MKGVKADTNIPAAKLVDYDGDLSKNWYLDIQVKDAATGEIIRQRIRSRINSFKTVAERRNFGEAYIQKLRELLLSGYIFTKETRFTDLEAKRTIHDPNKMTLQDGFQIFIDYKSDLETKTTNRFKATLRYLKQFEARHKPILLKNCEAAHIETILNHILETRQIQPKTYNHYRSIFSAVFHHFQKLGLIKRNPVALIQQKRVQKGKRHFPLTLEQIRAIKEIAISQNDLQFVLFISFSFYTLARPGRELRFLRVGDIQANSIWISPENAKTSEARRVEIVAPLRKLIAESGILDLPPDYYIFTPTGKPGPSHVGICYFYRRQLKYLKMAGLDGKSHDLYCYKHSGAIQMIKSGFTAFEVMQMAGHKNVQQTMDYLYNIGAISRLGDKGNDMPAI